MFAIVCVSVLLGTHAAGQKLVPKLTLNKPAVFVATAQRPGIPQVQLPMQRAMQQPAFPAQEHFLTRLTHSQTANILDGQFQQTQTNAREMTVMKMGPFSFKSQLSNCEPHVIRCVESYGLPKFYAWGLRPGFRRSMEETPIRHDKKARYEVSISKRF